MMLIDNQLKIAARKIKIFFSDVDGTLTDGCTYYSKDGEELKKFSHRDGRGVYLLREENIKFGIITGENTSIVKMRAKKLKADYCFVGITDKRRFVIENIISKKYSLDEIAYIGDDTNDTDFLKDVGLSFAVNDAEQEVKEFADIVCSRPGGKGAFREAANLIITMRLSKENE